MFKIPYEIVQKIQIQKPVHEVFQALGDFKVWNQWSPWLCLEPQAKTEFLSIPAHQVGHCQKWDGEMIGSGQMTLSGMQKDQSIQMDLEFFKPWKNTSQVQFELSRSGEGTLVTWKMQSTLPFFMFFLKKMMIGFISNDFRRGLLRLKELLETGKINSTLENQGVKDSEGFHYVMARGVCKITELDKDITVLFKKVEGAWSSGKVPPPEKVLSFTYEFDVANDRCDVGAVLGYANPLQAKASDLPEGVVMGSVPAHKSLKVLHTGGYHQLGNAWSMAMTIQRFKKLRIKKTIPLYEMYLNSPHETPPEKLLTQVNIPVS